MEYLPRIIDTPFGLREKIENIFRDSIPMKDKQNGIFYRIEGDKAIFFNRKTSDIIATYIPLFYNKYKKV